MTLPSGKPPSPDLRKSKKDYLDSWANDFALFASEALMINAKGSKPIPLNLNPAQLLLLRPVLDDEAVKELVLKARQVGSSTFCVMLFVWLSLFRSGRRIAIVAQQASSSKTILKMAAFAVKHLPKWMRKMARFKAKCSATQIIFKNGSTMQTGTANSEFWRGGTFDGAVLTEATSYNSLEETMSAILPAVNGPVFIESTAKGMGLFKDLWDDMNVAWRKVFISWLIDPSCRRSSTTQKPTAEDTAYIIANNLDTEQTNWYLHTKWTVYSGNQKAFDQECPATAELAFIVAGNRFFSGRIFQVNAKEMPANPRHDWLPPEEGHKYLLGIDVAAGALDGDASTGVLLDVTNVKDIKVASVLQCWLPTPIFSQDLIQMAQDYGPHVLAIVESNVGLDVIRTLKRHSVRQYVRQRDTKMVEQADEYGFCTTAQSRPLLMASLTRNVMGNVIKDLADPRLKDEANSFVYNKDGKPEAVQGKRDDLILALALALQGLDQYHLLSVAPQPKRIPPRPVHDVAAMLAHDKKYGIKQTQRSPY